MNSMGMSDKHFIVFIQPTVLLIFVIIVFLTIYAVPWAKHQKNIMKEEAKNASEFSFITEGEFEEFKQPLSYFEFDRDLQPTDDNPF